MAKLQITCDNTWEVSAYFERAFLASEEENQALNALLSATVIAADAKDKAEMSAKIAADTAEAVAEAKRIFLLAKASTQKSLAELRAVKAVTPAGSIISNAAT